MFSIAVRRRRKDRKEMASAGRSKKITLVIRMDRLIFNFLCVILVFGMVPKHVRGRRISNDEVEVQQDEMHKSIIKSIQVNDGNIFDCYLLDRQPTFSDAIVRGHKIQMEPTSSPRHIFNQRMENSLTKVDFASIECPIGSVPIHRTNSSHEHLMQFPLSFKGISANLSSSNTNDDHYTYYAAHGTPHGTYHGARASISVWAVEGVSQTQRSGAFLYVGADDNSEYISVGWFVFPASYNDDKPRLTAFWKGQGRGPCLNTICPGYVQVHPNYTLGSTFSNISDEHQHYYIAVTLDKDPRTHNWWLYIGDELTPLGYWDTKYFSSLATTAQRVVTGGMVSGPTSEKTPPMGDGRFPHFIPAESSNITNIFIIDENHYFYNPWKEIQGSIETKPLCYKVTDINNDGKRGALFAYGGPSGCNQ